MLAWASILSIVVAILLALIIVWCWKRAVESLGISMLNNWYTLIKQIKKTAKPKTRATKKEVKK